MKIVQITAGMISAVLLLSVGKTADRVQEACYGVSPLSYDLSNLAPMDNKIYAAWDDKIYFRQYSDEDMEDGALWGKFGPIADTEKELMCMESDGSVVQVGTDFGCGNMFIVNGRIYSQSLSEKKGYQVYSCGLDGKDRITYQSGRTLAVCGDKIICQMGDDYGELVCIDARSGQERVLTKGQAWCQYLNADEEQIFFYGYQINDETGTEELVLYSTDYKGNIRMLRMFPREEYMELMGEEVLYQYPMEINNLKIAGDTIYFATGSYNGNAKMYSGGPIYSMKRDGSGAKVEAVAADEYFYLYNDGENRVIYYGGYGENVESSERYGEPVGDEGLWQVTLYGEAPKELILPSPFYGSYDTVFRRRDTGTLLFYPDDSGICYVLLTAKECEELSVKPYVNGSYRKQISDIEYVGGKLFFTVTDVAYNRGSSIGWRDYYDRGAGACYCKELESGNIRLIYEY